MDRLYYKDISMNQHSRFNLPLCMVVEENLFDHVDETVKGYLPELQSKKAILVTEEFLRTTYSEIVDTIAKDFGGAEVYDVATADFDTAVALAKKVCIENIQIIIGFGGGRVLDTAKYAAFVSKAVYICLPTTLSNDSLASPFAVLGTQGTARKTLPCKIPTAILVDTDMIAKAPISQTLSGIGDTIGKYTSVYDWELAAAAGNSRLDDFAHAIAWMCYDSVAHCDNKDLKSKSFMKTLSRSLVMGGLAMEIAGSSRPCSGSEHLFAHAIEELCPTLKISHGLAVALGSIGAANFQGRDDLALLNIYKAYGLDLNPATYGINEDLFVELWQKAATTRPDRVTILNETDLDHDWLIDIYRRMQE